VREVNSARFGVVMTAVAWSHLWVWRGVRAAGAMAWMTMWPLVFGLALSGVVRATGRGDRWRRMLGRTNPASVAAATGLGVVSSSCSYAASATARSLFSRGASFPVAMAFMIASTNLVIELGAVIAVLLGWPFLAGAAAGGVVAIVVAVPLLSRLVPSARAEHLREHVVAVDADAEMTASTSHRWVRAARFSWGDLLMIRREVVIGFLIAGFLAADLPSSWWHDIFLSGHGTWTTLADAAIAPLVALLSFVCSVGNIPLAAALWTRGVAAAGVVAFILADLVSLPLVLIYRRFYGTRVSLILTGVLWTSASVAGLVVGPLVAHLGAVRTHAAADITDGHFAGGATLWLNVVALMILGVGAIVVRRSHVDDGTATDPVCGMAVVRADAPARVTLGDHTYYFCAPRCATNFETDPEKYGATVPTR
jgi:uncharacterized protein